MTKVRLEHITKRFGAATVVRDLNLTVLEGEFFTVVGPSGCGKSTVLNMIAGLEPVTTGRILFDDAPVQGLSPRERDVAMVFQSYALYPHMTVRENIAFPLVMRKEGKAAIEQEVRRVAGLLGLAELLGKRPRELSGGQRQRVALGRAIVRKPRVFLMDEPLSNLDAQLRIGMRAELKKLHAELGITTVYVTHDQAEAMALSDRIAVLAGGDLQQCGAPREVYLRPANTFVAGFIGSPPMNLFRCTARKGRPFEMECGGAVFRPLVEGEPAGSAVIAGVRPEDVVVSAGEGTAGLAARVSVVESAGPFDWIDADWNGISLKAAAPAPGALRPGDEVRLTLPPEKLSVFDESGRRL
jgi:multiple sugar transport system ATP-binding protein